MWSSMFDTIFFSGLCSSSVTAALALMTVITQLLLWTKFISLFTILGPSITSTYKGLTRIRPLSCGFDNSVGRALHRHRRGHGFESRSEPEIFFRSLFKYCYSALALMTVITQLLLWGKLLSVLLLHRCFETLIVCPCLFIAIKLCWNFKLCCFYFFQNLCFQIGGAANLQMCLIHGRLQYQKLKTSGASISGVFCSHSKILPFEAIFHH